MASTNSLVGKKITLKAGTRVTSLGKTVARTAPTEVTVRAVETTRSGNTRIVWKSRGYRATAVI
jgi:sporulation protein YlmC with PRC-barrel domain